MIQWVPQLATSNSLKVAVGCKSVNASCAVCLFCGGGTTDLDPMVSSDHTVEKALALLDSRSHANCFQRWFVV